jgi:N-acetyl-alpha-D-muramate 1-phosphate uridylyltransferase
MSDVRFDAGILAAGHGERFARAGVAVAKPLLRVGGKALIERAIETAAAAGAARVAVIVNAERPEVAAFVQGRVWPVPVALTVRTTASSLESLLALAPELAGRPFLLLTVDAILAAEIVRDLARSALDSGADGVLGVTRFVHDETPLRAALDGEGRIVALGAGAEQSPWITSGVYFFAARVLERADAARARRLGRLRDFLAFLVERGLDLRAHPTGESIDVDDPEDLVLAERRVAAEKGEAG